MNTVFEIIGRVRSERVIGPEEGIDDAATIDSYEKLNRELPFRIVRKIGINGLKRLLPSGLLADLGCGPGYFTRDIAKMFPELEIIALDISDEMLKRAKKNLASLDFRTRLDFKQGDIGDLPFDNNSLDIVVSTLSLHHWDNPQQSFREIHRVLKPDGRFMVYDTRRDSPWFFYLVMKIAQKFFLPKNLIQKNEPTSSVMASYTPDEAKDMLANTPFTETAISGGIFWMFLTGKKP